MFLSKYFFLNPTTWTEKKESSKSLAKHIYTFLVDFIPSIDYRSVSESFCPIGNSNGVRKAAVNLSSRDLATTDNKAHAWTF